MLFSASRLRLLLLLLTGSLVLVASKRTFVCFYYYERDFRFLVCQQIAARHYQQSTWGFFEPHVNRGIRVEVLRHEWEPFGSRFKSNRKHQSSDLQRSCSGFCLLRQLHREPLVSGVSGIVVTAAPERALGCGKFMPGTHRGETAMTSRHTRRPKSSQSGGKKFLASTSSR